MDGHALVRFAKFRRSQTSHSLCQASIVALSINSGNLDHKIAKDPRTTRVTTIAHSLIDSPKVFMERDSLVPDLYTLNLCAEPTIWDKLTKDAILLPYLVNVVVSTLDIVHCGHSTCP
jgi:hypothetical protein